MDPRFQPNPYQNPSQPHYPGQGGYLPPSQYPNPQQAHPNQVIEKENLLNAVRLEEIDKSLQGCAVRCFQAWLCIIALLMIWAAFTLTGLTVKDLGTVWMGICIFWTIAQAVVQLVAISQKSLSKANIAVYMSIVPIGLAFGTVFVTYLVSQQQYKTSPSGSHAESINRTDIFYFTAFCANVGYFLNFIVSIVGSVQVKKILNERNTLQIRSNESNLSAFQA